MAEAERVLRELARAGMTRADHVVALGGGVVGDLAGFCASTYQRGVPFVAGPDLARGPGRLRLRREDGGRPAGGQELLGAYHQPSAVLVDLAALATLPAGSWRPASSR